MSTRKLLILTGVFFALLAFVVLWERHQPTSEERAKAKKRLLDLDAKAVAGLVVERPDLPRVELSRKDGLWLLEGPKGGPRTRSRRTASSPTSCASTSSARRGRSSTRRSTAWTRRRRRSRSG